MVDRNGNPDTREVNAHWAEEKQQAVQIINTVVELDQFNREFTAASKTARVERIKAAHPDCAICQRFEGNLPA